jgi:hypothetical protein
MSYNVTIVGPLRDGMFHVHTTGCADIARNPAYRGIRDDHWTADVVNTRDVVEEIYCDILADDPDGVDGWEQYDETVHIFPCVRF